MVLDFSQEVISVSGVISPGVGLILSVAAPHANLLASVGACFSVGGQSERLGVEWGVLLVLGFF